MLRVMAEPLNPEALAFFREHGSHGGKKRTAAMTKKQRSELARKAAQARWKKSESAKK